MDDEHILDRKNTSCRGAENHVSGANLQIWHPRHLLLDVPLAAMPSSICIPGSPVTFINGKKHGRQRPQAARERGTGVKSPHWQTVQSCSANGVGTYVSCSWLANTGGSELCGVHGEFLLSPMQLQRHSSLNLRELIRVIYVSLQHGAWWSRCGERKEKLAWEKMPLSTQSKYKSGTWCILIQRCYNRQSRSVWIWSIVLCAVSCSACCPVAKYEARK